MDIPSIWRSGTAAPWQARGGAVTLDYITTRESLPREAFMKKICASSAFALAAALTVCPAQSDTPVVVQKDPALAELIDSNAKLEKIAGGFGFTEGALWVPKGRGYLLFSEMP